MEQQFYQAARDGKVEEVKKILRNHSNLNVNWRNSEDFSRTALHRACANGHDSIVSVLLAHPDIIDVNRKVYSANTPFFEACVNGKTSCVRVLLKDLRVDNYNEPDNNLVTPLRLAAACGHLEVIKWWIASGREMDLGERDHRMNAIWAAKNALKTEVAAPLERFKNDATKTRDEVRKGLGITGRYSFISFIFSLTSWIGELKFDPLTFRFPCDHPTNAHQGTVHRLP